MRKHGLTVDNLEAVELVTADAELIRVDATTEPELFWGLRGGGGNFGIATSFTYRLHPVGPLVLAGPIVWTLDDAPAVLAFLDEFIHEAPDELGIAVSFMAAPPAPFLPFEAYGQPALVVIPVWAGDLSAGAEATAPLRALGSPLAEVVRPVPYLAVQNMLDGGAPHGRHYYWKAHRLPRLDEAVIDAFMAAAASRTAMFWQLNGWAIGGAVSRVDPDATAVGDREVGFEISVTAAWAPSDPEAERHTTWVRENWEALRPHSVGVYANFISDEGAAGVEAAYGGRLARLVALKDRYDPTNVFRMNANIPPSTGG